MEPSGEGSGKSDRHDKGNQDTGNVLTTARLIVHQNRTVRVLQPLKVMVRKTKAAPFPLHMTPVGPRGNRESHRNQVKVKETGTEERALPLNLRPDGPRATRASQRS